MQSIIIDFFWVCVYSYMYTVFNLIMVIQSFLFGMRRVVQTECLLVLVRFRYESWIAKFVVIL